AAPSGQVLAQDPAPGSALPPGSAVTLQVSDGSLVPAAPPVVAPAPEPAPAAAPAVTPAPAAASAVTPASAAEPAIVTPATTAEPTVVTPAPATAAETAVTPAPAATAQARRLPIDLPSNTTLTIGAAIFLALVGLALLMRHWLAARKRTVGATVTEAPVVAAEVPVVAAAMPEEVAPAVVPVSAAPSSEIRFTARHEAGEVMIEFVAPRDVEETSDEYSSAS
ncbi:MAG: PASTA domain-containing protein, partial [Burkholderiaceae bacterium]